MDENELKSFSWGTLFTVTFICALLFTGAIYLLDGRISLLFVAISAGTLVLAVLNRVFVYLKTPVSEKTEPEYVYRD